MLYRSCRFILIFVIIFIASNLSHFKVYEKTLSPTQTHDTVKIDNVFECGYEYYELIKEWFPKKEILHLHDNVSGRDNDILVYGKFGSCLNMDSYASFHEWLVQKWKGKLFVINGEGSMGSVPLPNSVQIGVSGDSNNSVHVLYASIALIFHMPQKTWNMIFSHEEKQISTQEYFCIYAHGHCIEYREIAADMISQLVSPVSRAGRCRGKNGTLLMDTNSNYTHWKYNYLLFKGYRFCLVMENENAHGYVTEKILMAFLGGCIPIYYGTREVFDVFNHEAFIYFDIDDPIPAINQIKELEENRTLYDLMIRNEKILRNGTETIRDYFSLVDSIENGFLKQKILRLLTS